MNIQQKGIKILIVLLMLVQISAFALAGETQPSDPKLKVDAIINLEGIEPADQIAHKNGILEIGSGNIVDSTMNTLIDQGLVTASQNVMEKVTEGESKGQVYPPSEATPFKLAVEKISEKIDLVGGPGSNTTISAPLQNAAPLDDINKLQRIRIPIGALIQAQRNISTDLPIDRLQILRAMIDQARILAQDGVWNKWRDRLTVVLPYKQYVQTKDNPNGIITLADLDEIDRAGQLFAQANGGPGPRIPVDEILKGPDG